MTLAERAKAVLAELGRGALKLRGQHFLVDERVLAKIVEASGVKQGDRVLEIGPGLGFLTERLRETGCELRAIELDPAFAERLGVEQGDVLAADLPGMFGGATYQVVANIPYNISAKLLERLVATKEVRAATLLVQKEVAERVAAKPGDMNMLALMVQSAFAPRVGMSVPAGAFAPPPRVASAVLLLARKDDGVQRGASERMLSLAKRAFAAPRKKIMNTLGVRAEFFAQLGLTGHERPAELSLEQWVKLAEMV